MIGVQCFRLFHITRGGLMKIGFIGLGIMGSRMAGNLQKKGHELIV